MAETMPKEEITPITKTALEMLARPVEDFIEVEELGTPGWRPLKSTPTQQRTFDPQENRPDTVPDISQE